MFFIPGCILKREGSSRREGIATLLSPRRIGLKYLKANTCLLNHQINLTFLSYLSPLFFIHPTLFTLTFLPYCSLSLLPLPSLFSPSHLPSLPSISSFSSLPLSPQSSQGYTRDHHGKNLRERVKGREGKGREGKGREGK